MNFLELYRYMRNYLFITVSGGFSERFLNLCYKEKIHLWNTRTENNIIKTNIFCRDFIKLMNIRKKSGVKIKIIKKVGIAFTLKKHRDRKLLMSSLLFMIIFCITMNQFIWDIDVIGTEKISKTEILQTVEKYGLKTGAFAPLFDEAEISRQATNYFNGKILWMAINIKGSRTIIEVRERENIDDSQHSINENPCNIIADFDGQIISAETFSGSQAIEAGSAVQKGDLLISGVKDNEDASTSFVVSSGKISALHKKELEKNYSASINCTESSIEKTYYTYSIFFFKFTLPFKMYTPDKTIDYNKSIIINNNTLPFKTTKYIAIKQDEKNNRCDVLFCVDNYSNDEFQSLKNTLLIDSAYRININNNTYNIVGEYKCIDFIGEKADILREN